MGRGDSNQASAKKLLYGPRPKGGRPKARPGRVVYRPAYNGLSALAIIGSCHTNLEDKAEVLSQLTCCLAAFSLKAEEWQADSDEVIERGLRSFQGEAGAVAEEGLPPVGTPLAFSAEQSLFAKPHPDLVKRADKALDFVYPDEFDRRDTTSISDSVANIFHIARIYDIDISELQKRAANLVIAEGLKRGP